MWVIGDIFAIFVPKISLRPLRGRNIFKIINNDYARMSVGVIPFSERSTEDKKKSAVRSDYLFNPKDGAKVLLLEKISRILF